MSGPNPDIVAKLYRLDPDTIGSKVIRRWDGTPATPEEIAAFHASRLAEWRAVTDLHQLALEQSEYELDRKVRVSELCDKYRRYSDTGGTTLGAIEARMVPPGPSRVEPTLGRTRQRHGPQRRSQPHLKAVMPGRDEPPAGHRHQLRLYRLEDRTDSNGHPHQ